MKKIEDYIRSVPDFPKKGIMFRDITSALQDKEGLKLTIDSMERIIKDMEPTVIAGAEARGFLLGMPVAYNPTKLPMFPLPAMFSSPIFILKASFYHLNLKLNFTSEVFSI